MKLALHRALAQHAGEEADRLDRAVQHLLAHTTAAHLLAAVGHALTRTPGAAPRMNPTDEQTAAADAFHAGDHLALQAGAGTGKTTTLALLARTTQRRGRYLAYNRAIAQDATRPLPRTPCSARPPTPSPTPPSATATPAA